MEQYKPNMLTDDEKSKLSPIGLATFDFSKRIATRYNIFRKSSYLPALIFLRLFGTRSVNKITNIKRMEYIYNYFNLNFKLYFQMINRLERILSHPSQPRKLYQLISYIFYEPYFRDTILSPKNISLQGLPIRTEPSKTGLNYETSRLINIQKTINNYIKPLSSISDRAISSTRPFKKQVLNIGTQPSKTGLNYETPQLINLQKTINNYVEPLSSISDRAISSTRPFKKQPLTKGIHPFELSSMRLSDTSSTDHKKSRSLSHSLLKHTVYAQLAAPYPLTDRRRAPLKMGGEDFYFRNQQKIEQEVEEIKKIIIETKESVSEKSATTHFFKETDIKLPLDINRLSDQVYQNIERRIRIERERRGL